MLSLSPRSQLLLAPWFSLRKASAIILEEGERGVTITPSPSLISLGTHSPPIRRPRNRITIRPGAPALVSLSWFVPPRRWRVRFSPRTVLEVGETLGMLRNLTIARRPEGKANCQFWQHRGSWMISHGW